MLIDLNGSDEKFYTQKDFAALTGYSTKTINEMVAKGRIPTVMGRIPESAYQGVLTDRFLNTSSRNNVLVVSIGASDEELNELKGVLSKIEAFKGFTMYDSINELVSNAIDSATSDADSFRKEMQLSYNLNTVKRFVTEYKSSVQAELGKIYFSERYAEFDSVKNCLPFLDLVKYLAYGVLSADFQPTAEESAFLSTLNKAMKSVFERVTKRTGLVRKTKPVTPLFNREDMLTNGELLRGTGDLYIALTTLDKETNEPMLLGSAEEVSKRGKIECLGGIVRNCISTLATQSFMIVHNITPKTYADSLTDNSVLTEFKALLRSSAFSKIYVAGLSKEDFHNLTSVRIVDAIDDCNNVEFLSKK